MEITDMITNLGFPVAVAAFALWNSYKHEEFLQDTLTVTIKENTEALEELKNIIEIAVGKNDEEGDK